jgi:imidazolonepropionase-like amidohydrolase
VLTLKAAELVDIDAGEIVRPGIPRVAGTGGPADGEVIDLGELILLPGLMDMEVNLLMGGQGETAASPPSATWGCSSRPGAACGTWRWRKRSTRAGV